MEDWQSTKPGIKDCISHWFNNSLLSDITFIICKKQIPGHKFVLASRSSVFFAMFYGPVADSSAEVEIPDCEDPSHFVEFLKFLYTDTCNVSWSNLFTLMYLGDKYFVTQLFKKCEDFLKNQLNKDTALLALQESEKYQNKELTQRCLEVIRSNASEIIKQENFQLLSRDALKIILSDDRLAVNEVEVFLAVQKWCHEERKRRDLTDNPASLRDVIGNAVYLIRFPCMKAEDFAKHCAHSGLLLSEESRDIYSNILLKGKLTAPKLSFSSQPRHFHSSTSNYKKVVINPLPQSANHARTIISGFGSYHPPSSQSTICMSSVAMTFQVDKKMQLFGLGICIKQEEEEMLPCVGIQCFELSGSTGTIFDNACSNSDAAAIPFSMFEKEENPTNQVPAHSRHQPNQRHPDLPVGLYGRPIQASRFQAWSPQPINRFVKSHVLFDQPIVVEENTMYKVVITAQWQITVVPVRRNMPEELHLEDGGRFIFTISNLFFSEFLYQSL